MLKTAYQVIASPSLGFSQSLLPHTQQPILSGPALGEANVQVFANAVNGNLAVRDHTKLIHDGPFSFELGCVYNSQAADKKWRLSVGKRIAPQTTGDDSADGTITLINHDGAEIVYTHDVARGCYVAKAYTGGEPELRHSDAGGWEVYYPQTGFTEHYDAQRLQRFTMAADGSTLAFDYDQQGNLMSMQGPSGEQYCFERTEQTLTIIKKGEATQTLITYELDKQDNVQATHIPVGNDDLYTINYHYDAAGLLDAITQSDTTSLTFGYTTNDQTQPCISTMTDGEAQVNQFNYQANKTIITDQAQNQCELVFNPQHKIESCKLSIDAETAVLTEYAYNDRGQLIEEKVDGKTTHKFGFDNLGLTQHVEDGLPRAVDFQHDSVTGVLQTKTEYLIHDTQTIKCVTRYIYNNKRQLRFEISAEGRVAQHEYDAKGGRVKTRHYLLNFFLPEKLTYKDSEDEQILMEWCATQPPTQQALQEFKYNTRGQVAQDIAYAAVSEQGEGIKDGSERITDYTWNASGQLLNKTVHISATENISTTQTFDGLQRLTCHTDPLGQQTQHSYYANQHRITEPNGKVTISTHDKRGEVTEISEQVKDVVRTTQLSNQQSGAHTIAKQSDGTEQHQFKDGLGRVVYQFGLDHRVTHYVYDSHNQVTDKIIYAAALPDTLDLNTQTTQTLQAQLTPQPGKDSRETWIYDAAQQLRFHLNPEGTITEHEYNAQGLEEAITIYANQWPHDKVRQNIEQGIKKDLEHDRRNIKRHDQDKLVVAEQDGDGYVTHYRFNGGAHCETITHYSNPQLPGAAMVLLSDDDATEHLINNGRGECLAKIDAENFVTAYERNVLGKAEKTTRYHNKTTASLSERPLTVQAVMPEQHANDQQVQADYDAKQRMTRTVTADNLEIVQHYDADDHLIDEIKTDLNDPTQQRRRLWRYDGFGQQIAALNEKTAHLITLLEKNHQLSAEERTAKINAVWESSSTRYHYDDNGLKIAEINPANGKTHYFYNDLRQLIFTINSNGAISECDYDFLTRLPQQTRQYEQLLPAQTYAQLNGGFIKAELIDQLHALRHDQDSIEKLEYDLCKRPVTHTDAENYQTRTEYNSFGEVRLEQIPITHETHTKLAHEYNRRGLQRKKITDADNLQLTETLDYNHHGKVKQHVDANQNTTLFGHDKLGRQTTTTQQVTLDPFAGAVSITTSQEWGSAGRLTHTIDAEGHRSEYTYDQSARQTTITLPSKKQIKKQNNAFGEEILSSVGDAEKQLTKRRHYNESGRLKKEWDELNRETAYHYNLLGLKSVQRQHGVLTIYEHDQAALLTKQTSHADQEALDLHLKNDSRGRLIEKKDANNGVTVLERDKRGNVARQIIDPEKLKLTTQFTHNALNAVSEKIIGDKDDANQYDETQQFDTAGRLIGKTVDPVKADKKDALAITTQNTLDAVGNIIIKHDALSRKTYYFYNELNQPLFKIDANGKVSQWGYTLSGKKNFFCEYHARFDFSTEVKRENLIAFLQTHRKDGRNRAHHYYYDLDNQCRFRVRPGGFVTEKQFDAVGNQIAYIRYPFKLDMSKQPFANLEQMQAHITERNQQYQAHAARTAQYIAPVDTAKLEAMPIERHAVDLNVTAETPLSMLQKRAVYKVYGEGRQLRFIIDANGKVIEKRYDERGNHIASIVYSDRLPNLTAAPKNPEDVAKLVDAKNGCRITRHLYDGFNRELFKISPSGIVTRKFYEGDNLVGERRYAKAVTDLSESFSRETLASLLQPDDDNDRIIGFQYDAAKRRVKTTFNTTVTEEYTLTALGKTRLHKDKDGAFWETEFDRAGRETVKYTPAHDVTLVQYDTKSNQLTKTVKKDQRVATKKDYDAVSNVVAITEGFGTEQARTIAYQHDEMNRTIGSVQHNVLVDNGMVQPQKDKRPDVMIDITTHTVRNIFGQELVERNEAGFLKFKIYDDAGRLRFTINENNAIQEFVRDAYSQAVYVIHYNHPIALDLTAYAETGLTEEDVEQLKMIQPDAAKDRVIKMDFTPGGEKCLTQQSAAMQYIPAAMNEDKPQYGFARPCVRWTHNAYGEVVKEETLFDPFKDVWATERTWYDAEGHMRAHLDAERYLTLQYSNIDNLPVLTNDYAHRIKDDFVVSDTTSVNDLLQQVVPDADNRVVLRTYTPYGFKSTETRKNVVVQKISLEEKTPDFKDEPAQDLTTHYVSTPSGRPLTETSPTGATRYWQWDARGQLVSTMGAPRTLEDGSLFYPVKQHGYGIDAQAVAITECATSGIPSKDKFIPPAEDVVNDRTKLILHDNRGLPITTQDQEGAISHQSYKALRGQEAREWRWVRSRWEKDAKNEYQLVQDYQETSFTHNNTGKEIGRTSRSDHGDLVTTVTEYNTFDEKVAEGESQDKLAVYWHRDNTGRVWSTNESGIATLSLGNAAGAETLTIRAKEKRLGEVEEAGLPELVAKDYTEIQQTEVLRDLRNGVVGQRLPAYAGIPLNEPEPMNLSFTVGTAYAQFGNYSVSWPEPDDKNLVATFKCWPKNKKADIHDLTVHTVNGRMGVDVSGLDTDEYEFRIEFAIKRVDKKKPTKIINIDSPSYFCTGTLPIVTAKPHATENTICRMTDDAHLSITGDISKIAGIQLLQNGNEIGTAAGSTTMTPNELVFDLSEFVSGEYQIRLIRKFIAVDEPIAVGASTSSGTMRLIHVAPDIKQQVKQIEFTPRGGFYDPDRTSVRQNMRVTTTWNGMLGEGIARINHHALLVRVTGGKGACFPELEFVPNTVALPASNAGEHALDTHNEFARPRAESFSTVIRNRLEVEDKQGKLWPYGEVLNGYDAATNTKPFLCVISDPQSYQVDALQLVYAGGTLGGHIGLTPYLNGWMRAVNPPASERFQALRLDKDSVESEDLISITLHTRHQSPRLIAREICLRDFKVSKVEVKVATPVFRIFPQFYWTLPEDLNCEVLNITYTANHKYTPQTHQLPVGRNHWLSHSAMPISTRHDSANLLDIIDVTATVMIDGQQVPILWNASTTNVNRSRRSATNMEDYDEYDTQSFNPAYTMWISPFPVSLAVGQYHVEIRKKHSSAWIAMQNHDAHYTTTGVALNVAGLEPDVYEFRLAGAAVELLKDQPWLQGEMIVKKGEQLLVQQQAPKKAVIRPERRQTLDRWGNAVELTDTNKNRTQVEFNKSNQPVKIIKPEIDILNQTNGVEPCTPTVMNAYNTDGALIGTRSENGHATVHVLDQANTLLETVNAEGVATQYANNGFGEQEKIKNGNQVRKVKRNKKKQITEHTEYQEAGKPLTTIVEPNELGQVVQTTNPMGEKDRYGYRLFSKRPIQHITANGVRTDTTLHHTGLPIEESTLIEDQDLADLPEKEHPEFVKILKTKWERDYFGLVLAKTQPDDVVIVYEHDETKQVRKEFEEPQAIAEKPHRYLIRVYDEAGYQIGIIDAGTELNQTTYRHDTEGRTTRETFVGHDGTTYQSTCGTWDAAGRLIDQHDTQIRVSYGLDAVGNRRVTKAEVYWDKEWQEFGYEKWYTYNKANQRLIHQGIIPKDEKTVQKAPGGSIMVYGSNGLLESEEREDKDQNVDQLRYEYYDNGLLKHVWTNGVLTQERKYDEANRCIYMMQRNKKKDNPHAFEKERKTTSYYGPGKEGRAGAGQLRAQLVDQINEDGLQTTSLTEYFYDQSNPGELLVEQKTTVTTISADATWGYRDHAITQYELGDTPRIKKTDATRAGFFNDETDKAQNFHIELTYDGNGHIAQVKGAVNDVGSYEFVTNAEGRIVRKRAGDGREEFYLYDGSGNMLGRFGDLPAPKPSLNGKDDKPVGPKEIDMDLNFKPMTEQLPTPGYYVAQQSQNWEDFVRDQGGDVTSAAIVAFANGAQLSDQVPEGRAVIVPNIAQLFDRPNRDGFYAPYNNAEIVGSLYPNMPLPRFNQTEQHAIFWHELIEVAIAVAIVAFAPELAGFLATLPAGLFAVGGAAGVTAAAAAGTAVAANVTAYVVAGGIMGAAGSLAQQGTAMALGDQSHLDWGAVATAAAVTAATAGVARSMELNGFSVPGSAELSEASRRLAQNEVAALVNQAANSVMGRQRGMDWRSVALNALTAAATTASDSALSSLGKQLPAETLRAVMRDELSEAMASKVYHREFNAEHAAASALGTVAGNALADKARNAYQDYEAGKEKAKIAQEAATMKAGKQSLPEDKPILQSKAQPQKTRKPANEPMPHRSDVFSLNKAYETLADVDEVLNQAASQQAGVTSTHIASQGDQDGWFMQGLDAFNNTVATYLGPPAEAVMIGTGAILAWPFLLAAAEGYGAVTLAAAGVPAEGAAALGLGAAVGGSAAAKTLNAFGMFGKSEKLMGGTKAIISSPRHELAGLSPANVVRLVDEMGLKTPRDELILWSGLGRGREGIRLSQDFARANGGVTLEMTSGGKWLDEMDLFGSTSPFTRAEAGQIWEQVSTKMIRQASGNVRSVIGQVSPSSVYRAEQEEILMNEQILGLDELYLKPRFIFGK